MKTYHSLPTGLLLALLCATPAAAQIQVPDDPPNPMDENVCPIPYDGARSYIEWHLTDPEASNMRESAGTEGLSPEDVHPLNSVFFEGDAALCQQLDEKFGENDDPDIGNFLEAPDAEFEAAYFKAGDRYFALFSLVPPEDTIVSGITEFVQVLDSDLDKIVGFAH